VWNQLILEIAPDGKGSATVVWQWSLWDHLVQDFKSTLSNFGQIGEHPLLFDINYCPPGGKANCRNQDNLKGGKFASSNTGLACFNATGVTGEKDWIHCNSVSFSADKELIAMSFNVPSEIILIEHTTTTDEAKTHTGGRYGCGGDILWRWGNPQVYRAGNRLDQSLFVQHCANFIPAGYPGAGNILLFHNGRAPDRHWSSVDEFVVPEDAPGTGKPAVLVCRMA
jgi:hypothetical protein